jgi:SAM-dependent methyltransferase
VRAAGKRVDLVKYKDEGEMHNDSLLDKVRACFDDKFGLLGATPQGVYWNSVEAQETRFAQLKKLLPSDRPFSILDYGCGYGALAGYLERCGYSYDYTGFDISTAMVAQAREVFAGDRRYRFTDDAGELDPVDYVVASGIFNLKLDLDGAVWTEYVLQTLETMNSLGGEGVAFNMLTSYSDADRKQPDLYYADPCFFFDYCKRHFSRNVALLHDYELYDFTIIVRK